jgi:hypothetical protein
VRNSANAGLGNIAIDQEGSPAWKIDVEFSLRDETAGESWSVSRLASMIGREPSRHWKATDIYQKTGNPRRFHFAGWRSRLPPESSLAAHLESILELLDHTRGRWDEIREYDPCIGVLLTLYTTGPEIVIEPELMRRIGATGTALSIDLFVG